MTYEDFVSEVVRAVETKLDGDASIILSKVPKNNDSERVGLTFVKAGYPVAPTVYLEESYQFYMEGHDLEDIVLRILEVYKRVDYEKCRALEDFYDFERVKRQIIFKVVNLEMNRERLKDIPYLEFLDLAITFHILADRKEEKGIALSSLQINNELMDIWGVDRLTLYQQASVNTMFLLPVSFMQLDEMIGEMMDSLGIECPKEDIPGNRLFVFTNAARSWGAGVILYEQVLEVLGEAFEANFYILPSSVHEVILIPENLSPDISEMERMVRDVNETELREEDILSFNVYYYDRKAHRLRIA